MIHHSLVRMDTRPIPENPDEIRLFSCVRNEMLRLPYFLEYYRNLGVHRFFFVDNSSCDGSLEFLLAQADTHVFTTEESYASSRCGVDWLNAMLQFYGIEHWVLVVDADELFVYPGQENIAFNDFLNFLDSQQAEAVLTFLLDMYSKCPIKNAVYPAGTPFLTTCPYFDADTYQVKNITPFNQFPIRGGVRKRLFFDGFSHRGNPPVLHKFPLVKWRSDLAFEASTHLLAGVSTAMVSGVLLHFKLFSDFIENIQREVTRKEHWDEAAQYCAYSDIMKTNPNLKPYFSGSVRYINSQQLVDLGLIRIPKNYLEGWQRT